MEECKEEDEDREDKKLEQEEELKEEDGVDLSLSHLLHIGSEPEFRLNFHFYLRKYLRTLGLAL